MPNPYFKFKQFTVFHDLCAMKVGTDGVLLGAWARSKNPQTILDIGSGSGLISLMMAQRFPLAEITAVEIEENGYRQSCINAEQSQFNTQIKNCHVSIQAFAKSGQQSFDLIISNPPFFEGAHSSGNNQRDLARHNFGLKPDDFWLATSKLSHIKSLVCLILPVLEAQAYRAAANKHGWFLHQKCEVKGSPNAKVKRLLLAFGKAEVETETTQLTLEISRGNYTDEFSALVKDFYLKL